MNIAALILIITLSLHAWAVPPARLTSAVSARISSLDPFSIAGIDAFTVTSLVLEPLARIQPDRSGLRPWLAQSWSVDVKRKTFRVRLRDDVRVHDGSLLRAEDVKHTFDAYRDPNMRAELWQGMWPEVVEARVMDPLTVEFQMRELSYTSFETLLITMRILPRSFYVPENAAKFRTQVVGTGPFRLARFEENRVLEFEPFAQWWGDPKPQFVLAIKPVDEPGLAAQMFAKGDLDFFVLHAADSGERLKGVARVLSPRSGLGNGFSIELNKKNPLFQSRRVREALVRLWDREALNKTLFAGRRELCLDGFSPNLSHYPAGQPLKPSLKRARELLSVEGWKDRDRDGILERKGQRFEFELLVRGSEQERWASLYQADAAKAGIKVTLRKHADEAQWLAIVKRGTWQAYTGGGGLLEGVSWAPWHSQGFYNYDGYINKDVDRMLSRFETEFDSAARARIQTKLIRVVRADLPAVPGLCSRETPVAVSARMEPDVQAPLEVWRWRLKDRQIR